MNISIGVKAFIMDKLYLILL